MGKYRLLVKLVDRELAVVISALRDRGLWDRTLVVLLSDHGEGLGEHPRLPDNHGRFVYNALVHVPLAFRIPGVPGARLDQPVSLLDVHPTLIQLTGAALPAVAGESLLPLIVDDVPPELRDRVRPLPLNETDQYGVVLWPYKLLVRRAENLPELYDLAQDFGELHDLAAKDPQRVAALRSAYAALPGVEIDRTRRGRRERDKAAAVDGD
jgi:arylsulfatase A-like enzyme